LDQWPAARAIVTQFWNNDVTEENYDIAMYVYVEMDNLEYVIEKYIRGFMEPRDALRGLNCFKSRCVSSEFRRLACQQVEIAGYKPMTIDIVNKVCEVVVKSQSN
jgi:hypothetical protein